jgi:hypothetical protein
MIASKLAAILAINPTVAAREVLRDLLDPLVLAGGAVVEVVHQLNDETAVVDEPEAKIASDGEVLLGRLAERAHASAPGHANASAERAVGSTLA